MAALLVLAGCASHPGVHVWWNPLTWGTNRAATLERVDELQKENTSALTRSAQIENAKTIEALKSALPSRSVEVARRTADNAQAFLDKAVGTLTMKDFIELRKTVANLISENSELRAEGERSQAKAEATAAKLTEENESLKAAKAKAEQKLAESYEAERRLANQVRNFWFIVGGLAFLWLTGNLISVAARFYPGLSGVARAVNGVAAPALAYAEARAAQGLQKVGHALATVKEKLPAVAEQVVDIFDKHTDAEHQAAIGAAANTAPRT